MDPEQKVENLNLQISHLLEFIRCQQQELDGTRQELALLRQRTFIPDGFILVINEETNAHFLISEAELQTAVPNSKTNVHILDTNVDKPNFDVAMTNKPNSEAELQTAVPNPETNSDKANPETNVIDATIQQPQDDDNKENSDHLNIQSKKQVKMAPIFIKPNPGLSKPLKKLLQDTLSDDIFGDANLGSHDIFCDDIFYNENLGNDDIFCDENLGNEETVDTLNLDILKSDDLFNKHLKVDKWLGNNNNNSGLEQSTSGYKPSKKSDEKSSVKSKKSDEKSSVKSKKSDAKPSVKSKKSDAKPSAKRNRDESSDSDTSKSQLSDKSRSTREHKPKQRFSIKERGFPCNDVLDDGTPCPRRSYSMRDLEKHKRSHLRLRPDALVCQGCSRKYQLAGNLQKHKKRCSEYARLNIQKTTAHTEVSPIVNSSDEDMLTVLTKNAAKSILDFQNALKKGNRTHLI